MWCPTSINISPSPLGVLKDRATTHRAITGNPKAIAEDINMYKKSLYNLCWAIKQAKTQHRNKLESYYTGSEAQHMWQGIQYITDYKGSRDLPNDASLLDELITFMHTSSKTTQSPAWGPPLIWRILKMYLTLILPGKTGWALYLGLMWVSLLNGSTVTPWP